MIADTIHALSNFNGSYPSISTETLTELVQRGLFSFDSEFWRFGDENNGSTRRLDGRKWRRADNSGTDWHKLIGLSDVVRHDRKHVMFVIEGSKDALAAAEIAFRLGILPETGIVCALGSGYRPIPSELQRLRGRRVRLIGDRDAGGVETTLLVSRALSDAGVEHGVWDWSDWPGEVDKDLYDALTTVDSKAGPGMRVFARGLIPARVAAPEQKITSSGRGFFSSLSPSHCSTVQQFNSSTQETGGVIGVTIEQFVAPYAVTKRGTGNRKSFDLARAVKTTNANISMSDISTIFVEWFAKSRAFLPKDADRDKSFQIFLKQLTRVRFMDSSLKAAFERARIASPPFIPALDGNVEAATIAALCRELQREAGGRSFICPVNVAQQFLNLRWPAQAHWLLHQLELNDVIECIDRGIPNTAGKKGKPTMWRYKLPL